MMKAARAFRRLDMYCQFRHWRAVCGASEKILQPPVRRRQWFLRDIGGKLCNIFGLLWRPGNVTPWPGSRGLRLDVVRLRRRQREIGSIVQHLPFLRRKLAEASRLQLPLASFWRHSPQRLNCVPHRLATLRRQAVILRSEAAELLLLFRLQMLPHLAAPQYLLLTLGRQTVEMLQPLLILLLPLRRQMAELRIVLQRPALLIERLLAMLVQPLAKMMSLLGRTISILSLRRRCGAEVRTRRRLTWRGLVLRPRLRSRLRVGRPARLMAGLRY